MFGLVLRFAENKSITKNTGTESLKVSALALNMTKINVYCSLIDTFKNFDMSGEPSDLLVSIPIDTEQPLYGSITHYDFANIKVPCKHFYGHDINFEVESSGQSTKSDYIVYLRLGVE